MYRTTSGKLHLAPEVGKISLSDCRLIEDPNEKEDDNNATDMEVQDGTNEGNCLKHFFFFYDEHV